MGGSLLFPVRLGFSGTPSDLLPLELGKCQYEPGTDGKLLHLLTNPEVVSFSLLPSGWTVLSLLDRVATQQGPGFHALIDTGALVTGLTNKEVARYLLEKGLVHMEGVVFLDEEDRSVVLVRDQWRTMGLHQCGISPAKRFTFYDQV